MTSATHIHLNFAKDALPSTMEHNESFSHSLSVQHGNQNLDSSESIPSEHSSLYEAARFSFQAEDGLNQAEGLYDNGIDHTAMDNTSMLPSEQSSTPKAGPTTSSGKHVTWCLNNLDTITEQRNATLLGPSAVLPDSFISRPKPSQPNFYGSRRRDAFSLDDLDAQMLHRKRSLLERHHDPDSSSSNGFEPLREYRSPAEPAQPILPPPVRVPTPPGLPSFGSPEAMRYRNRNPPSPSHGRHSSSHSAHQPHSTLSQGTADPNTGNNGSVSSPFRGGSLRRLFISCFEPQPTPLAPGVIGRAEDGTLVRGRFGTRQSGHGIGAGPGSRGLAAHPFHRSSLPTARPNEVVQVDGSPQSSRDEGLLSQPEAFAPPRTSRASSSESHSSVPFPSVPARLRVKPSPNIGTRTASHAGTGTSVTPYPAYRNPEPRLPRIIEMTNLSRADTRVRTSSGQDSGLQRNDTAPSPPNPTKEKSYWTQFQGLMSLFCCGAEDEKEHTAGRRSQVDGNGEASVPVGRSRSGSMAGSRSGSLRMGALGPGTGNTPWRPAWGCQPGRIMGADGVSEDG
ncbi:hypothetical protein FQN54_005796 [Arachnomyces sp. PD_36]|nr:hypothetical protein FQN54_005796 [Arachnomyces sp. PD_36]